MSSTPDEITIEYEESGQILIKELDKVILSKGAWTTILFRYQELDAETGEYGPDKYAIRRYQKSGGEYRQIQHIQRGTGSQDRGCPLRLARGRLMHTLAQMLSAVLVTAFFFFQTAIAHADGLFSATVTQCTDGDTLVLDTGQRVRLAGVDTPEKGSKDTPPQYYAREAARFTCERTRKQRVKVIPLPGASRDRYQRLVAEIILPDGRSLNEQLLQQGMASFYAHKNLPSQLVRRLTAAQKDALDKRAGCWGFILTRPQAQEPYIGNRNSKRFFSKACLRTANISKKNQIRFSDLEEAFRSGYAPARPCGIWPSAE